MKQEFDEKSLEIYETYNPEARLQEMGMVARVGDYELLVYSNEGTIPHFHFKEVHTKKEGCLKILTNAYFKHGKYQAELNPKERKDLQRFLTDASDNVIYRSGTTNFMIICNEWNMNNPANMVDVHTNIPNYEDM